MSQPGRGPSVPGAVERVHDAAHDHHVDVPAGAWPEVCCTRLKPTMLLTIREPGSEVPRHDRCPSRDVARACQVRSNAFTMPRTIITLTSRPGCGLRFAA